MVIDLKPEQQRMIDLAIQSGAFHNSNGVIVTALAMLAVSRASRWPRWKRNCVHSANWSDGIPRYLCGHRQKGIEGDGCVLHSGHHKILCP